MYKINRQKNAKFKLAVGCVVILIAFGSPPVVANPVGSSVANGQASFVTRGNTLTVTNTPGTIINWQSFSIKQNEITRFAQQSASSAVLNRVTGNNPSNILGSLQSNGRVFLINSSGIVFGAGATVDVAGMVASTLNLSNAAFLAGKYNFTAVPSAANLRNAGNLNAQTGGQIYLIAPNVTNTGVITAANGDILLAAGHSVELLNTGTPNLRVNITAPAGEAMNVGTLVASAGNLGLYGALVKNSGTASADSVMRQGGKIVFKSSVRTEVTGRVSANGITGGTVQILGQQVGVMNGASVMANGTQAGGTVLVGGDYQGKNPDVQNSQITFVASTASIHADGGVSGGTGDGGKVVIWSNDITRVFGSVTASGGTSGGNGGFIETSGKKFLVVTNPADAGAPKGRAGSWLLDPNNVTIQAGVDTSILAMATAGLSSFSTTADSSILTAATIQAALNAGTSVTISTSAPTAPLSAQLGDITVNAAIAKTAGAAATLTLNSHNNIAINAPITSTLGALNIALNPGINVTRSTQTATISANVDTLGGTLTVGGSGLLTINAGTTTLNSANTFSNLTLTGTGVLTGTGAITIANQSVVNAGIFNWTGGTLSGSGTFTTTAAATVTANIPATATTMNGTLILDRPFVNNGTMTQGAGTLSMTVTPLGSLTNSAMGSLVLGNGATGGSLLVNGIFSNLGGVGIAGTGISNIDASGATIGTISNSGTVNVAAGTTTNAGATLNWTAGQTATNTGAWNIGSTVTPLFGGVLNLGEVVGAPVGTTQTYSGTFINVGTTNINSGTNSLTGKFSNNGQMQFGTVAAGTNSYNGAYSEAQLTGGFAPAMIFTSGTNSFNSTVAVPSVWTLFSNGGTNTFDTSTSVTNLSIGMGSTLTGLGSLIVPANGNFNWYGGTLASTGVGANAAMLTLNNTTTTLGQNGVVLTLNRGLINNGVVGQTANPFNATLNIGAGGSFTNNGTLNFGSAMGMASIFNVSDTGVFTNGVKGVVNVAGSGGGNAITATLGAATVGTVTNNGAVNVQTGSLTFGSGLVGTNTGTFSTAVGSTLLLDGAAGAPAGSFSGAITNNGTLIVGASNQNAMVGPLVNNGAATLYPSNAGSYTGAYSGTGALTLTPLGGSFSFTPTLAAGYVFSNVTYSGLGTLNFNVPATITNLNLMGSDFRGTGAITIPNQGVMTVSSTTLGGFSNLTVTVGATATMMNAGIYRPVINQGTMNLTGISTISTVSSTSGANNGSLTNTGLLNLSSALLPVQSGGVFTNNVGGQVFALTGGNIIDASGLFFAPTQLGTITNNGAITVNNAAVLTVTNGFSSNNSGTYTNTVGGTLNFANATGAPATATYAYANANALTNNGTASVTGTSMGNVTNTGALTLSTATVNGTLANNGAGTITTAGVNSVSGAVTNASTAANGFNLVAGSTVSSATAGATNNLGSTFTIAGTFIGPVTSAGTLNQTGMLTGALTNAGILSLNGTVTGDFVNSGTASVGGAITGNARNILGGALTLNTVNIGGTLVNSQTGIVTSAGMNTVSSAITNASTAVSGFNVAALSTLNAAVGTTNNLGSTFTLAGTLVGAMSNAGTLNQTGTLTGALTNIGTASLGGATTGNVTNTGVLTLNTATLGGTLTNAATLNVVGAASLGGLVTNSAAATLNIQAGSAPTLNALAGLNNAGVINLSNPALATGSSTLAVTGALNNTGVINSIGNMGGRVLTASSLINSGLIAISYPMTINGVSYVAGTSLPLPPVVVPKPVAPPPLALLPAPTPVAVSAGILPQLVDVTLVMNSGASSSTSSPTVSHSNKKLAGTVVAVNGELVPENSPLEKIPVCR